MLMLIVFVHELGHFLTARMFGVRVKEFMLGLPGPSIGFSHKGTRYGITCLPLGGYARIAGMEGGAEHPHLSEAIAYLSYFGTMTLEDVQRSSEKLGFDLEDALDQLDEWGSVVRGRDQQGNYFYAMPAAEQDKQSYKQGEARLVGDAKAFINSERKLTFRSLSWWKRVVILVAGAAFNLIFAILVFAAVMLFTGQNVATTTVDTVTEDSPAMQAGILPGDRLISVDGTDYSDWQGFTTAVSSHSVGDAVRIGFERDGARQEVQLELAASGERAIIGVTSKVEHQPISLIDALATGVGFIAYVATAIVQLFNPATFAQTISQSSSVVGVSVEARNAAAAGFMPFIVLTAALSISIGLMNLLPLPPLDGGKIIVETIQRLIRRELPVRIVNGISIVGLCLLVALFLVCTSQDIQRYFLGG
jgi:regulator of sigma E protease